MTPCIGQMKFAGEIEAQKAQASERDCTFKIKCQQCVTTRRSSIGDSRLE